MRVNLIPGIRIALHTLSRTVSLIWFVLILYSIILIPGLSELAHQWFGNLVTMDWWNELWLNEGFATWVGWLAVDHFYPGKDITFLKNCHRILI